MHEVTIKNNLKKNIKYTVSGILQPFLMSSVNHNLLR